MSAVDVPVALLGYGTVGSAVHRLVEDGADEIERATGHRLRVVRALVRDPAREREHAAPDGLLTGDFGEIRTAGVALVAEVMGGIEPTEAYVLELLRGGTPVVTANKQLVARSSPELFAAAAEGGVQLRFEASVCATLSGSGPTVIVWAEDVVVCAAELVERYPEHRVLHLAVSPKGAHA